MNPKTHQSAQTLFALLIACVFTAASLLLVVLGAFCPAVRTPLSRNMERK